MKDEDKATVKKDIAKMSFEEAMSELEAIVKQLEEGKIKLEEAVSYYERGIKLKKHCEEKLQIAQATVTKITASNDMKIEDAEPFC